MPVDLFMQTRMRQARSNLQTALVRVNQAASPFLLMQASQVHLPAELRAVMRSDPAYRQLHVAVEQRAQKLVDPLVADLAKLMPNDEETKEAFSIRCREQAQRIVQFISPYRGDLARVHAATLRQVDELLARHLKGR